MMITSAFKLITGASLTEINLSINSHTAAMINIEIAIKQNIALGLTLLLCFFIFILDSAYFYNMIIAYLLSFFADYFIVLKGYS